MRRILVALIFILSGSQIVHAKTYVIKKGDTLASVARSYYGEPVFGASGTLKKIYKLNPWARSAGSKVEPGQILLLEDLSPEKLIPKTDVAKLPAEQNLKEVELPPTADFQNQVEQLPENKSADEPKAAAPMDEKAKETEEEKPKESVREAHSSEPKIHHELEKRMSHDVPAHHLKKNEYSILPFYTLVNQTSTDAASNISYTLNASSYGAELGWSHHWNESFSSVLTYAYSQISSSAVGKTSGIKFLDALSLNQIELALLNQISSEVKIGLGLAYKDHLFLEGFSDVLANPSLYKASFLNPFLNAEITAYESERLELLLNLKLASLPAQNGQGHDLSSGTEFFAELAAVQKFESFALLYSLSYAIEDQTRVDARETRNESMLKIGLVF